MKNYSIESPALPPVRVFKEHPGTNLSFIHMIKIPLHVIDPLKLRHVRLAPVACMRLVNLPEYRI